MNDYPRLQHIDRLEEQVDRLVARNAYLEELILDLGHDPDAGTIKPRRRKRRRNPVIDDAIAPCVLCGAGKQIHFHHGDPDTKLCDVSAMHSGYTDQQVRDELAKCVCLCRRCHEGVHQNLRDYPF